MLDTVEELHQAPRQVHGGGLALRGVPTGEDGSTPPWHELRKIAPRVLTQYTRQIYSMCCSEFFKGDRPMRKACLVIVPVFLLALGSMPVSADCVSCGPGGECTTPPPGYSANCECRIRSLAGAVICTPHGVCSATDPSTCDNDPMPNLAPGGKISTKFLQGLADKNPLLAGAVWGAFVEKDSPSRETLFSKLVAGEYKGTMGKDGKSYTFRTQVQSLPEGAFSLAVHVEETGTGRADDFEGIVLDEGRSGNLMQAGHGQRRTVFSWAAAEQEK